jgi:hypothetical protein
MGDVVRVLNEEGIRRFQGYLGDLRQGVQVDPPWDILTDTWCSARLQRQVVIDKLVFKRKLEAARYLEGVLGPFGSRAVDQHVGLWTWITLYYFDQLCPPAARGMRRPGADYRFILDLDFRRYYRHLLVGPYTIFKIHKEKVPLLLHAPLQLVTKFNEELGSRQGFITNRGVMEAANYLYFDPKKGKAKSGAAVTTRKPGTLIRFVDVIQQLDLTYDLHSMTGREVVSLLPPEFDEWRGQYTLT